MDVSASFTLNNGPLVSGRLQLTEDSLRLAPPTGEPLFYSLRDIIELTAKDYQLELSFLGKEKVLVRDLGLNYDDFYRNLNAQRNEVILQDMFVGEKVVLDDIKGAYKGTDCELRIYETSLVILPAQNELTRLYLADITDFKVDGFTFTVTTVDGGQYAFSQLGFSLEPLQTYLQAAIAKLILRAQEFVKSVLPAAEPSKARDLARLLKEGLAAGKSGLDKLLPDFWPALEKKLGSLPEGEAFKYLFGLSQKDKIQVGLKRGLLGDLTGDYIWFLFPIPAKNAIALEAINLAPEAEGEEGGSGKATYFFRAKKELDQLLAELKSGLREINFRREPIYLDDPKYAFSIARLAGLRLLRELFIGRVIHTDPEQWQQDVLKLLK
jgi:hypothetical protein